MTGILDLMSHKGVNVAAELAVPFAKRRQQSGQTGDYLEFGTFQGQSLTAFYRAAQKFGVPEMRFFGFDSFEGLPETPTCPPLTEGASETAFLAGNYACSQAELTTILKRNGVDMTKVTLVPGYYNESLSDDLRTELAIDVAGIINIDCDLYESSVDALSFVTSLLRSGTILIFDDWLAYDGHPFRGEQRACQEWLEANPQVHLTEYFKYSQTGVAFIVTLLEPRHQAERSARRGSRLEPPRSSSPVG